MSTAKTSIQAVEVFGRHVIAQLKSASLATTTTGRPPLFVAMQGPQGSGKTTIATALVDYISTAGYTIGVLSMDDLYLTHAGLQEVARDNKTNKLLSGRGQPGTHDIQLGTTILDSLHNINSGPTGTTVQLPRFDKSLYSGQGDRAPPSSGPSIQQPLDVFVLEGWSMGFSSVTQETVEQRLSNSDPDSPLRQHSLQHLLQINANLKKYEQWYRHFSVFLQISPIDLNDVYTWRMQQEHAMKAANGGKGMTDSQVKA